PWFHDMGTVTVDGRTVLSASGNQRAVALSVGLQNALVTGADSIRIIGQPENHFMTGQQLNFLTAGPICR
ncbi:hypothetical protein QPL67_29225, partial [Escherichia coli]|uniref:hypothetical protein n=1 Tax=Escherichia coli TaxID=562 RepID=UPI00270A8884